MEQHTALQCHIRKGHYCGKFDIHPYESMAHDLRSQIASFQLSVSPLTPLFLSVSNSERSGVNASVFCSRSSGEPQQVLGPMPLPSAH